MKKLLKTIVSKILSAKARAYLKKNKVKVVAITGSLGKTSTKEAVYHVLKGHFNVLSSKKGFNTEIGLSLAVLGEKESGFSSPFKWLGIIKRSLFEKKKRYDIAVLEMGADRPGDIKKLTNIARPDIAVITCIKPIHLDKDQFKNIDDIRKEKETIIRILDKNGAAVLNSDDPQIKAMETKSETFTFGTEKGADIRAENIHLSKKGITFEIKHKNTSIPLHVPVLGAFQIYALLPAIAVGLKLGIALEDCARALKDYRLPPGRMSLIEGVNGSHILDGSYNASPESVKRSLDLLRELHAQRKISALGTMNELGDISKEEHLKIGGSAAGISDILIAVGQSAPDIKQGALDAGMPEAKIFTFFNSEEAGSYLKNLLGPDDLVLVKGSQNKVRMEKAVKIMMKNPQQASFLLCRQDKEWENI